jgi:hypothetical protein
MRSLKLIMFLALLFSASFLSFNIFAETVSPAPIFAALLTTGGGSITQISGNAFATIPVLVMPGTEQSDLVTTLKDFKSKGKKLGAKDFSVATTGSAAEAKDGSILIIPSGNDAKIDSIIGTCNAKKTKLLCVSNNPEYIKKGLPFGIGIGDDNKPKFFVNKASVAKSNGYGVTAITSLAGMVIQY